MKKLFTYLKIGMALLLSYGISVVVVKYIVIDYSPQVRPDLPQYLALTLRDANPANWFAKDKNNIAQTSVNDLKTRALQIAPGVRASEYKNSSYIEYDLNKVEWRVIEYTLSDGRKVTIRVPKIRKKILPRS